MCKLAGIVIRQRIDFHHVDGLNVLFYKIMNGNHVLVSRGAGR